MATRSPWRRTQSVKKPRGSRRAMGRTPTIGYPAGPGGAPRVAAAGTSVPSGGPPRVSGRRGRVAVVDEPVHRVAQRLLHRPLEEPELAHGLVRAEVHVLARHAHTGERHAGRAARGAREPLAG